jgi:hypothetical protein
LLENFWVHVGGNEIVLRGGVEQVDPRVFLFEEYLGEFGPDRQTR